MSHTPQDRDGTASSHARRTAPLRSAGSLFVRVNLVALALAAAGLFLPRVTAGGYGLATIRSGYGQVFGLLLLLVCAALAGWYATRADWLTAALLFVMWLGLLATASFEVVRVSASYSNQFGLTDVGVGLYCNAAGAAVGAAAGAIEAVRQWSDGRPRTGSDHWLPWFGVVAAAVMTLAAVGVTGQMTGRDAQVRTAAGLSGPRSPFALRTPTRDQSPVEGHGVVTAPGSSTTAAPGAGQAVGPSAAAATPTTLGTTGVSGAGDSGNSGDWGMDGGLATYWPGYTGTPGSFYIWPGYLDLGPATNTGATGNSGPTVTGASGLTGSGVTGSTGAGPTTTTTTSVPPASSAPPPLVSGGYRTF